MKGPQPGSPEYVAPPEYGGPPQGSPSGPPTAAMPPTADGGGQVDEPGTQAFKPDFDDTDTGGGEGSPAGNAK